MPRVGATYTLPNGYQAVSGEIIQPSQHNPPLEDIAQALTDSLPRDGSAAMTGNLAMGGNRISGLAAPLNDNDATRKGYVDAQVVTRLTEDQVRAYADGRYLKLIGGELTAGLSVKRTDGNASAPVYSATLDGVTTVRLEAGGAGYLNGSRVVTYDLGDGRYLSQTGGSVAGSFNMSGNRIINLAHPVSDNEAARKSYVDGLVSGRLSQSQADNRYVPLGRSLTAGAGLVGMGDLSQNRSVAMGTPGDITRTSTNEAAGNTHTHRITGANFRDMMANFMSAGSVGQYLFASYSGTMSSVSHGQTVSGGALTPASERGAVSHRSGSATGTWQCLGYIGDGGSLTLWQRVS